MREATGKNPEIYEVLTLFVGFLGLNRLYLDDVGATLARLLYFACAVALGFTGLALLSTPVLAASGVFVALLFALWVRDYTHLHSQVAKANAPR